MANRKDDFENFAFIEDERPNRPSNRKKNNNSTTSVIVLLVIVAFLVGAVVGILVWALSGKKDDNNGGRESKPSSVTSGYTTTSEDPVYSGGDVTSTVVPVESEIVTSTPEQPSSKETEFVPVKGKSGSFTDTQDYKIKLYVEYQLVENNEGKQALQLKAYLRCRALQVGARQVDFTVNGVTESLTAEKIDIPNDGTSKDILLGEKIITVDGNSADVEVNIPRFKVNYAGAYIESFTAAASITF